MSGGKIIFHHFLLMSFSPHSASLMTFPTSFKFAVCSKLKGFELRLPNRMKLNSLAETLQLLRTETLQAQISKLSVKTFIAFKHCGLPHYPFSISMLRLSDMKKERQQQQQPKR